VPPGKPHKLPSSYVPVCEYINFLSLHFISLYIERSFITLLFVRVVNGSFAGVDSVFAVYAVAANSFSLL
jgi:hypothetical protein